MTDKQQQQQQSTAAVQYFDALNIFTKGDLSRVQQLITPWMQTFNNPSSASDPLITACTPLHLAVQCPRKDVIQAILDSHLVPIDARETSHGMTALHLAAKASRRDVVKLLLRQGADDMLLDSQQQDPLVYATDPDVAAAIQDHRLDLIRQTTNQMFAMARQGDEKGIKQVLDKAPESSRINLAARDPETNGTLLHLAVQRGSLELAKWAITEGVDVFAVDSEQKLAEAYASDHKMRELLTQAPMGNAKGALMGSAPRFSGELHKWTNYAGRWKSRWLELEGGVLSYFKNKADAESACRGAINLRIAQIVMGKEKTQFEVHGKGSIKYQLKASDASVAKQWVHLLNVSKQWALENHDGSSKSELVVGGGGGESEAMSSTSMVQLPGTTPAASSQSAARASSLLRPVVDNSSGSVSQEDKDKDRDRDRQIPQSAASSMLSNESDDELYIARDSFFNTLSELKSQLFIQDRLLEGLNKDSKDLAKYTDIAAQTVEQSRVLMDNLERQYKETTAGWQTKMRREQERIDMLADNLRSAIVSTQQLVESTVRDQKSEAASPARETPPGLAAASTWASMNGMTQGLRDMSEGESDDEFADATDEFFDAVTNVVALTPTKPMSPSASSRQLSPEAKDHEDLAALHGYSEPQPIRETLPEITKGGPSLNLWSVIKGAIGKDLSKISVPVFFNEPTSFLQRFTEDMEYCDLLEIATLMPRSEDRTLFVAGFAMSNYASTFGRIAKPFNPLLGETYEYVRRDKKYRALSEQVEHHPPISACWVEGKNYLYHADTNIKSKFNGGSLTVVPTGVCHVELKLPLSFLDRDEERLAGEARQPPKINEKEGYFTEHYTWNKLTTNVNGIMIANFWIEHVGDLDVVNHRTGDQTKITFVPSGWMGKNKFKVTGQARSRQGDVVYEIGGDWTSKLVARPVNSSSKFDDTAECIERPAQMDDSKTAEDAVKYAETNTVDVPTSPFVLWKCNDRQIEGNTYHLTTYAMSLNDKPEELDPFLCPTDSRFRPDQRAMETGEYEQADREKSRLENKQRATRRRREQGELPAWEPRWFVKDTDVDSGEQYWRFTGSYWEEREQAAQKDMDRPALERWQRVEDIF